MNNLEGIFNMKMNTKKPIETFNLNQEIELNKINNKLIKLIINNFMRM
jgi:hypothetical protein